MYIRLDPRSGVPLYLQLKDQLRLAVATGVLRPGEQLPTVRDLAARLRINPNTIARVYRELQTDGLLTSRQGSGTFVSDDIATLDEAQGLTLARQKLREAAAFGLSLNLSPTALRELFARALREAQSSHPDEGGPDRE